MSYAAAFETHEAPTNDQVSTKRTSPGTSFPRKCVLSVFADEQDALQAAGALRAAGFGGRDIPVLQSHEFVAALGQDRSPFNFVTSMDYDVYEREAKRGRFFLAMRPDNYAQLNRIRDLLALHHAFLVKYIDTWTLIELLP